MKWVVVKIGTFFCISHPKLQNLMSVVFLLSSRSVHEDTVIVMSEKRVVCVKIEHRNETVEECFG